MAPSKAMRTEASVAPDLESRLRNLRWWNISVGLVLAAQAVVIAVLSNSFALPVVATYMSGPPGTKPTITKLGGFHWGGASSPSWPYPPLRYS